MNTWSYSKYSSAVQCLRKFKYCYVDQLEPDYVSGDLNFGSALHSGINAILQGEDGRQVFEIYWESYREKEVIYGRYGWEQLAALGTRFLTNFQSRHAKKYQLEQAEIRLYSEYNGTKLEGTPDFYGIYDGKRSLRDFKTSGYAYPKEKALTSLQLNLYTYLVHKNGSPYPETLGYTVFNKGTGCIQDLTWEFSEEKMYDALQSMCSYSEILSQGEKYPQNLNSCQMGASKCQYWSRCHGK